MRAVLVFFTTMYLGFKSGLLLDLLDVQCFACFNVLLKGKLKILYKDTSKPVAFISDMMYDQNSLLL